MAASEGEAAELRRIVDAIPALVFYKDADNRIVRVNRAASEALGVSATELVGSELRDWIEDGTAQHAAELQALRTGRAEHGVIEAIELPGRGKRWFTTSRLPQHDAAGGLLGLVVVSRDISEERR